MRAVAFASGKGGVGKTALCLNVAVAMAMGGRKVGIIDADLNSPAVMAMLGMRTNRRFATADTIEPVPGPLGIRIVSSALIADGEPAPFSFVDTGDVEQPAVLNGSGPVEISYGAALGRLLGCDGLGALDFLLIDLAPGAEQIHSVARHIVIDAAIFVTQSSEVSWRATRGAIKIAAADKIPVLGVIENMTGFNCDSCHTVRPLMPGGNGAGMAHEAGVPILARLPFDPRLAESCDRGTIFVREYSEVPLAKHIVELARQIERDLDASAARLAEPALEA